MRYFEFFESYTDDTNKAGAKLISSEFDLKIGKFAKEQGELVANYPVEYEDVVTAIRNFTKESPINKALISDKTLNSKLKSQYELLIGLKDLKYKLKNEHHVYSGSSVFDPTTVMQNEIFSTPSFLSCSLNVEVAAKNNNFHRIQSKNKEDHLIHLILPKGYSGCFYIGPYSESPEELEMLIFPNESFTFVKSTVMQLTDCVRHIHTFVPS